MLCFFWLLTYYGFLSLGKALGDKGDLHPVVALWLPNIVVGVVSVHIFRKACRESPLRLQAGMDTVFALVGQYVAKLKRKN
jgi:Lipopolysaccharide export system permease LptF/LptG